MRASRLMSIAASAALLVGLAGCAQASGSADDAAGGASSGSGEAFPVTVEHAYGKTVIDEKPKRVATVAWANHEVPLALGVVPVGMAKANYGDEDGDGLLPWVKDKLDELGAKTPVLFDETDSLDFEAIADTRPDVILAAYSGISKTEYETLSKIAPTVAFPDTAWGTTLDQMIELNATAMGMATEGERLTADLREEVAAAAAKRPGLKGKSVMFTSFDPSDLSSVTYYTTHDPRIGLFGELGMTTPPLVTEATAKTDEFYTTISAERADALKDVDVLVGYGDPAMLKQLQADPLVGRIPAVERGSVALVGNDTALAAAVNPSPLSIGWGLERYLDLLDAAASKAS